SSDAQASLPANYTFTSSDGGVHSFTATLKTAGAESLTATDAANLTASANLTVGAAAATALQLASPSTATAGSPLRLTLTAREPFGNLATGSAATLFRSSSDAQASLPANYTFTSSDGGVHSFTATLKTAGAESLTATDAANLTATANLTVGAAAATALQLAS